MENTLMLHAPELHDWMKKTPDELEKMEVSLSRKSILYVLSGFLCLVLAGAIGFSNFPVILGKAWLFIGFGFLIFSLYFGILYIQVSRLAFFYKKASSTPELTNDSRIDAYILQRKNEGHSWRTLDSMHLELLLENKIKTLNRQ